MLRHVTIASGGVLPKIHPELIGRKKGNRFPNQVPAPPTPTKKVAPAPVKKQSPAKKVAKGKVKKAGKQASPISKAAASVGKTALLRKVFFFVVIFLHVYVTPMLELTLVMIEKKCSIEV